MAESCGWAEPGGQQGITNSTLKSTPDSNLYSQHEACEASFVCQNLLGEIVRKGVRQMLAQALEAEVEHYLQEHASCLDPNGRRRVVRSGRLPARQLQTYAPLARSPVRAYPLRRLPRHAQAVLLGAHERQRPGQTAQEAAALGQVHGPRDLPLGHPRGPRKGLRRLH